MQKQRGVTLLILAIVMALATITYFLTSVTPEKLKIDRQEKTQVALKKAKNALINYAITNADRVGQGIIRMGKLPCPDVDSNNVPPEGDQDYPCDGVHENTIGFFPYKSIGVDALRDASGNCLLYAVSPGYKFYDDPATRFYNSDANGLFQIVDTSGAIIKGVAPADRPVAIVFAANQTLAGQSRNFDDTSICGKDNTNISAYLDNNGITDNGTLSGGNDVIDQFVHATTTSSNDANPLNDTFITISKNEIWGPIVERNDFTQRMNYLTRALAICLRNYSSTDISNRRLPWPSPIGLLGSDYATNNNYDDALPDTVYAGRYPFKVDHSNAALSRSGGDELFSMPGVCPSIGLPDGSTAEFWNTNNEYRKLWDNWKDHIFYSLSRVYAPSFGGPGQSECNAGVNDCITVNGVPRAGVVYFSGRRLAGQSRSAPPPVSDPDEKSDISNYLENGNDAVFLGADGTQADAYVYDTTNPEIANDIMWCITNESTGGAFQLQVVGC